MRKAGRGRWQTFVLLLIAIVLGAGLLIQGVGLLMSWVKPDSSFGMQRPDLTSSQCTETQSRPVFGQKLIISEHEVVCGDLTLFGSSLDVRGRVQGTILAFGSNIDIAGSVRGDVNLYGGIAILRSHSQVQGNINLYSGSERPEQGARLAGTVNDRSQHISFWLPGVGTGFAFPFWSMVIWGVLGVVFISLLPEHVMFVRTTAASKTRRSLLLGLLSLLLAPVVLIVLIALIIPVPLAILIAIGLIAAWTLGTIAIGWLVGDLIMRAVAPRHNTRLAQVTVGLTALVLVGSLPYVGWIVSLGAGLLGLGAVLLSRFGTRLYGQPRHPLPL
ncbi:MAG TPA: polymer-forming cytoskeletal protein [Ktedonobacteraceae bacterium]|nr:polymer-forming cytoskeletal protein [Ktedonobacteraceae bacterium]